MVTEVPFRQARHVPGVPALARCDHGWPRRDSATLWVGIDRLGHRVEISACSNCSSVLIARDLTDSSSSTTSHRHTMCCQKFLGIAQRERGIL